MTKYKVEYNQAFKQMLEVDTGELPETGSLPADNRIGLITPRFLVVLYQFLDEKLVNEEFEDIPTLLEILDQWPIYSIEAGDIHLYWRKLVLLDEVKIVCGEGFSNAITIAIVNSLDE